MRTAIGIMLHTFHAIKAADAPLDFVFATLHYFVCPMWVRNMRATETNKVLNAFFELFFGLLRRTNQVRGKHGYRNLFFDRSRHIFAPARFKGSGFQPIVVSIITCAGNVNRVYARFVKRFCHFDALIERVTDALAPDFFVAFVHGKPDNHRKIFAAGGFNAL